jgi:hypothetical protein
MVEQSAPVILHYREILEEVLFKERELMLWWLALLRKQYHLVLDPIFILQFSQMLGQFVLGLNMNYSIFNNAL